MTETLLDMNLLTEITSSIVVSDSKDVIVSKIKDSLRHIIESRLVRIPLMPGIADKILKSLDDIDTTFSDISTLIKTDPLFSILILKTASSHIIQHLL